MGGTVTADPAAPDGPATVWRAGARLGIDWGRARIGVAACDPAGVLAYPVETVANDDGALARLAALAREYEATEFVLGWPADLRGRVGPAAHAMLDVAGRLAREAGIPVRLLDERLTTAIAARHLTAAGRAGRGRRAIIDQVAAVVILEQALDLERRTGEPAGSVVSPGEES